MSSWVAFRKRWVKPDVYPLIASMAAALGVCGAALINKAMDPTVTWNKAKRRDGQLEQLEGVDEVAPLWSGSKHGSIRIFGRENPIMENKHQFTELPEPITVKVGEEEEEEEETVEETVVAAVAAVEQTVLEVVDEAAETINAAIDTAIQSASAIAAEAPEPTVSSVAETAPAAEAAPAGGEGSN